MGQLSQAFRSNLEFIGFCLLIFAGLVLLALAAERLFHKKRRKLGTARTVSFIAMFSAAAAVLMFLEIPLFFAPPFYKIDLSEIPILICSFYLGPVSGVVCELLKIVLKLLMRGTSTAFVGDFANFAVGCSFVLPASIVYHFFKTRTGAIVSLSLGTVVMTVFGSLFNAWYLIPKFAELYGLPLEAIIAMGTAVNASIVSLDTLVLFAVVPFNLLKGLLVSLLTFLLYKRVERLFFHRSDHNTPQK